MRIPRRNIVLVCRYPAPPQPVCAVKFEFIIYKKTAHTLGSGQQTGSHTPPIKGSFGAWVLILVEFYRVGVCN